MPPLPSPGSLSDCARHQTRSSHSDAGAEGRYGEPKLRLSALKAVALFENGVRAEGAPHDEERPDYGQKHQAVDPSCHACKGVCRFRQWRRRRRRSPAIV
jgi:hypothetical protein